MNKPLLTAAAGVLLVFLLFFFGRTTAPKSATATQEVVAPVINIQTWIDSVETNLTSSQSAYLNTLKSGIESSDSKQKLQSFSAAAAFWRDSLQLFEPYAYYISEASKLENSEKSLTFAAHLMLDNIRMQQDPARLEWMTAETIDLFERAIQLNPENDDLRIGLGSAYIFGRGRSGNPEATMQGIQELLGVAQRDSNNMKAQLVLGIGGMISGQFDKANARFLRIVEKEPGNLEAIAYLADTYAAMGNKAEAIRWYNISKKLADNPHYSQEVDERIRQLR
ncbi:MAG: tetratricopeptide repeat protein [Ferruginibacter sp.]|nr:tetratricopeptide repeat protein [Ferruginibacter sp.]